MSRLRNIPETCPIYKEALHLFDCLKDELFEMEEAELTKHLSERFTDYAKSILECVDQCRLISGELREMCVERGEKIQELETRSAEAEQLERRQSKQEERPCWWTSTRQTEN